MGDRFKGMSEASAPVKWKALSKRAWRWVYWNARRYTLDRGAQAQRVRPTQPSRVLKARPSYQDEFPDTAEAFQQFLSRARIPTETKGNKKPIGIVILPWVGTPMPWFSIAIAIGLARRGRQVKLIWDDTPFPAPSEFQNLQNHSIKEVLKSLDSKFEWLQLSDQSSEPLRSTDTERLGRLANLNVNWILRGRPPNEQDRELTFNCRTSLETSLGQVRALIRSMEFDGIVVPGGIYSSSGIYLWVGEELKVRVSTFAAGVGWLSYCTTGIAAQQEDIPAAFHQLEELDPNARQRLVSAGQDEYRRRVEAKDLARFQVTRAIGQAERITTEVLIPLNVDFDAAALGRHYLFENTVEWVTRTVEFVLANSQHAVVVRQHPSERRPVERARLNMGKILQDRFRNETRLRFVSAQEPTSTYDLLTSAALVLPFVSTIGIEAAAIEKPVLIAGKCYYSHLGFVRSANSREQYFELLKQGLDGELELLPQQSEKAWLCYYLTQVCNRVWTDMTPQPIDFWKWVRRDPEEVYAEPAVTDLLKAIDERVPLSLVRHARRAQDANKLNESALFSADWAETSNA
jgi:hypothetical protein